MDELDSGREGHLFPVHKVRIKFQPHQVSRTHPINSSYDDPFYHSIDYSPTDKDVIDRGMAHAIRLLAPHHMVLKMLFSRLQAAKYRRPSVMYIFQTLVLRSARACKYMR